MPPVRLFSVLGTLLLAVLALGMPPPAEGGKAMPQRLVIEGSTTMAPLLREAARRFGERHPGVVIEVRPTGSAAGLAAVRAGRATIGMVSRSLSDDERDLYGLPIARDGVAIVVHRENPITQLTNAQLAAVFGGRAARWSDVGGADRAIAVVASASENGSTRLFARFLGLPGDVVAAQRFVSNADRLDAVRSNPAAITYVSLGEAERRVAAGDPLRLLPVEAIWANSKNVRSGDYPISRPLTLVSLGTPTGIARAFFRYCGSAQIDDLVARYEFVPYLD